MSKVAGRVRKRPKRREKEIVRLSFGISLRAAWRDTSASVTVAMATPNKPMGSCMRR